MNRKIIVFLLFAIVFLFFSCDYGMLNDADKTNTYYPGSQVFEERLGFLSGLWYARYEGIGRLDSYRIRKWSDFTVADRAEILFPSLNVNDLKTYAAQAAPGNNDYIMLYDDTVYGQQDDETGGQASWGFSYMGLVRAVNIFNNDMNRGAVIIEYFEGADPAWLSDPNGYSYQGLAPGEKPFFGIYFRVLGQDTVQMANAVNLAALYEGEHYYTEKGTLQEAIKAFDVVNEAEFISWGVVIPQQREK